MSVKVVELPKDTSIEDAKNSFFSEELQDIALVGYTKDGRLIAHCSSMTVAELNFMLDRVKLRLMLDSES